MRSIIRSLALLLCLCVTAQAGGSYILDAAETFTAISPLVPDTAGTGANPADSVNVTVVFEDGTITIDSAWYNTADPQATAVNARFVYFDAFGDMDGASGVGTYSVLLRWYDGSGAALSIEETYAVTKVTTDVEATFALQWTAAQLDSVLNNMDDGGITATKIATDAIGSAELAATAAAEIEDSVIANAATYKATGYAVAGDPMALTVAERAAIEDSVHANAADYKATGFSTHAAAAIWSDAGGDSVLNNMNDGAFTATKLDFTAALKIADTVWDEILIGGTHNIGTSAGRRIREIEDATLISTGTSARVGSATSIVLAAAEAFADDILIGNIVGISSGTGAGQSRVITDYTGATDSAVVGTAWITNPDATSVYEIEPFAVQTLSTFDVTADKVTSVDSTAAGVKWTSLYLGIGSESAGPSYGVALANLTEYSKDTAFVLNNARNDTLLRILYIRNAVNGPVDSILFEVP